MALQYSESRGRKIIDTGTVKEAVKLVELFPKQSDLRLQAVRLLTHLEESGDFVAALVGDALSQDGFELSVAA